MNRPQPDIDYEPARQWRVVMKSGETWIVSADQLESFGTFGLAFTVANSIVGVVPHGQFQTCEEIDAEGATPYIRVLPASEPSAGARKTSPMIRALPAAATATVTGDVRTLVAVLPSDGVWLSLSVARGTFKEKTGGFPVNAYKAFNDAIAVARANGLIETTGDA